MTCKRLFGVLVVAAALLAVAVPQASAAGDSGFAPNAGPFCVTFDIFCDKLQISTDTNGNTYGLWDWTCDGVNLTSMIGRQKGTDIGTRPVANGVPFSFSTVWAFNVPARTVNLWGTDGVSPPFSFQGDIPFNSAMGPCAFAPNANGKGAVTRK